MPCRYGIYRVRSVAQTELDNDITMRELHLTDSVTGETRRVMHYLYHAWPDHGVPESTEPLRRLSQLLRRTRMEGSPVVHCSAGAVSSLCIYSYGGWLVSDHVILIGRYFFIV